MNEWKEFASKSEEEQDRTDPILTIEGVSDTYDRAALTLILLMPTIISMTIVRVT